MHGKTSQMMAWMKVTRRQIAKRLGRVGGAGLFAESQKYGEFLDAKESGLSDALPPQFRKKT